MLWKKRNDYSSISSVVASNLGVDSVDEIDVWKEKYDKNEYPIDGLDDAAETISRFCKAGKRIRICGDYDVDGRTASIILFMALKHIGCDNLDVRIPRRFSEGYGMKPVMIDEVKEDDALIITVDNGIAAFDAVNEAKRRGMTVVVTDHHMPSVENDEVVIPNADVVVDPHVYHSLGGYTEYCGAGIAYKLALKLVDEEFGKSLLPYAALATVADVVELREENYIIVREGLAQITDRNAPYGILALMDAMDIETCFADSIGYKLAPAINAPGRMNDHDTVTLPLLASKTIDKARKYADTIVEVNELRKAAVSEAVDRAKESLIAEDYQPGDLIMVLLDGVKPGILGIIAGRLSEDYRVPALVFVKNEDDICAGSARSVDGFNVLRLLNGRRGEFRSMGGHEQAAGMSVDVSVFKTLKDHLTEDFRNSGFVFTPPDVAYYDLSIDASYAGRVLPVQDRYEPYGQGNEKIIYEFRNFHLVEKPKMVGGNGVKLRGDGVTAIGFGLWPLACELGDFTVCTVYGTLSWNEFRGNKSVQIQVLDIKKPEPKKATGLAEKLRAM